jgi:hypothetical protein
MISTDKTFIITNCIFNLCKVTSSNSFGGIIHVDGNGRLDIKDTKIEDCSADIAGGIYANGVSYI